NSSEGAAHAVFSPRARIAALDTLEEGIVGTGKSPRDLAPVAVEDIQQPGDGGPQTGSVHEEGLDDDKDVEDGEGNLGLGAQQAAPVEEEPEDGADTEGEPGDECGRGDG